MDFYWLQGTELERLPAFATSLAIGLLIGLERERHVGTNAGLRTFALTALFAAVAALLRRRDRLAGNSGNRAADRRRHDRHSQRPRPGSPWALRWVDGRGRCGSRRGPVVHMTNSPLRDIG